MTITLRNRPVLGLTLAAAVLALTSCGGGDDNPSSAASSEESTAEGASDGAQQEQEPGLEGIPDVVAEVNGDEVTKDEFLPLYEARLQQAITQAQSGGEPPDEDALKEQTADNLVNTELLAQEAEARGISVTDQDVEDELASLAEENQLGSVEEFLAALEEQGATEDQARAQLESQLVIEQLIDDEAGKVEPSEQDLRQIYQLAKKQQEQAGQGQAIPPYDKVRPQLEEQAKADRLGEVAKALVDELRADAEIVIHL